jgi:hypothetical protein
MRLERFEGSGPETMKYEVNDTTGYHIYELESLGWELTVCNALEPAQYKIFRDPLADFIAFDFTDKVRYMMHSKSFMKDEHEIIRYFIEDLYQYEYLFLMKSI